MTLEQEASMMEGQGQYMGCAIGVGRLFGSKKRLDNRDSERTGNY